MDYALPPLTFGYMVLAVVDLAAMTEWYCKVLGFTVERTGEQAESGASYAVLAAHGMRLELCSSTAAQTRLEPSLPPPDHLQRSGWSVLTLHCADLSGLGNWLHIHQADVIWSERSLAPKIVSTLLRDPEGNLISIFGQ